MTEQVRLFYYFIVRGFTYCIDYQSELVNWLTFPHILYIGIMSVFLLAVPLEHVFLLNCCLRLFLEVSYMRYKKVFSEKEREPMRGFRNKESAYYVQLQYKEESFICLHWKKS